MWKNNLSLFSERSLIRSAEQFIEQFGPTAANMKSHSIKPRLTYGFSSAISPATFLTDGF